MGRILILGGLGFIGGHLTESLVRSGYRVHILDNLITGSMDNVKNLRSGLRVKIGDICNPEEWKKLPDDIDFVYNLASPASPTDYMLYPEETLRAGSLGVMNLISFCESRGINYLHTSTSEVYGDPLVSPQSETYWGNVNPIGARSVYDESKRFAEALIAQRERSGHHNGRVVRIFNTYGPGMRLSDGRAVPNFVRAAINNEDIVIYGNGKKSRSFCYVSDTVSGLRLVAEKGSFGPYNIGHPDERSVEEIADIIVKLCSSKSKITFANEVPDDPSRRCPDITKIKELGWSPLVPLNDGLVRTIFDFKKRLI